jgi:hypothetical protein
MLMARLASDRLTRKAERKVQRRVLETQPLPHSWCLQDWPKGVYPDRPSAARNLVRKHRSELVACGALTRVNRRLVILGAGFAVFLASKMSRVQGYFGPSSKPHESAPVATV